MKPFVEKIHKVLHVVIYSKNKSIAGDVAALLSNCCLVKCRTNLTGVLDSLNSKADVLLLLADESSTTLLDPVLVLSTARKSGCRVILMGNWPGLWRDQRFASVVKLPQIPSPKILLNLVNGQVGTG